MTITVDGSPINYSFLPPHMQASMRHERRVPPGSFLMALLSNDFMEACRRADDINRKALFTYASWLHSYAPSGCYGSRECVKSWLNPPTDEEAMRE
jgi:hypothetical protein